MSATTTNQGAGYYIARDHEDSTKIAVYRPRPGRHERVATGFKSRVEAERWIKFHGVGQREGGE